MKNLRIKSPEDMSLEELIQTQNQDIPLYANNGWLYLDAEEPSYIDKLYWRGLYEVVR